MPRQSTDPRIQTAHKTAILRVHNPSQKKRAMLDDCLYRYHLAFEKALMAVFAELDDLKALFAKLDDLKGPEKRGQSSYIKNCIRSIAHGVVKSRPLSRASKDGVVKDIQATVTAYLELFRDYEKSIEGKTEEEIAKAGGLPGKPTVPRIDAGEDHWLDILEMFHHEMSLEEERAAQDEMARERKRGQLRPVLFPRNRIADGFLLLWNDETDRYYIFLNLHTATSSQGRKHRCAIDGLIDLNTGEVITKTTTTGTLFPVEFGARHQGQRFIELTKTMGSPRAA